MDHTFTLQSSAEHFLNSYKKYTYYYAFIERLYAHIIPEGSSILHLGCTDGFIIRGIKSSFAVGVDDISFMTLWAVPQGNFYESLHMIPEVSPFDYILISAHFLKNVDDMTIFLKKLRRFSDKNTRIIIEYSFKSILPITPYDMRYFCKLSDVEIVTEKNELLLSIGVPFLANFLNYYVARLPIFKFFCSMRIMIARFIDTDISKNYSVSIIIPCKNEAGNIEPAITRIPAMGTFVECILVDGHSRDATVCVMQEMIRKYPEKKISWFVQSGRGKKNAVEEGFSRAKGDILMILDGDITVMPEELPKFYDALATGKGECINGSRLVYSMDRQAMKPLNWVVNSIFALMISYIIGQKVKDTLCGTKVFFKKDLKIIDMSKKKYGNIDPFGDFDIICGAAYCNLKILDVPVHYKKRVYGAPGVPFFKSGLLLLSMTYILFKKILLRK